MAKKRLVLIATAVAIFGVFLFGITNEAFAGSDTGYIGYNQYCKLTNNGWEYFGWVDDLLWQEWVDDQTHDVTLKLANTDGTCDDITPTEEPTEVVTETPTPEVTEKPTEEPTEEPTPEITETPKPEYKLNLTPHMDCTGWFIEANSEPLGASFSFDPAEAGIWDVEFIAVTVTATWENSEEVVETLELTKPSDCEPPYQKCDQLLEVDLGWTDWAIDLNDPNIEFRTHTIIWVDVYDNSIECDRKEDIETRPFIVVNVMAVIVDCYSGTVSGRTNYSGIVYWDVNVNGTVLSDNWSVGTVPFEFDVAWNPQYVEDETTDHISITAWVVVDGEEQARSYVEGVFDCGNTTNYSLTASVASDCTAWTVTGVASPTGAVITYNPAPTGTAVTEPFDVTIWAIWPDESIRTLTVTVSPTSEDCNPITPPPGTPEPTDKIQVKDESVCVPWATVGRVNNDTVPNWDSIDTIAVNPLNRSMWNVTHSWGLGLDIHPSVAWSGCWFAEGRIEPDMSVPHLVWSPFGQKYPIYDAKGQWIQGERPDVGPFGEILFNDPVTLEIFYMKTRWSEPVNLELIGTDAEFVDDTGSSFVYTDTAGQLVLVNLGATANARTLSVRQLFAGAIAADDPNSQEFFYQGQESDLFNLLATDKRNSETVREETAFLAAQPGSNRAMIVQSGDLFYTSNWREFAGELVSDPFYRGPVKIDATWVYPDWRLSQKTVEIVALGEKLDTERSESLSVPVAHTSVELSSPNGKKVVYINDGWLMARDLATGNEWKIVEAEKLTSFQSNWVISFESDGQLFETDQYATFVRLIGPVE